MDSLNFKEINTKLGTNLVRSLFHTQGILCKASSKEFNDTCFLDVIEYDCRSELPLEFRELCNDVPVTRAIKIQLEIFIGNHHPTRTIYLINVYDNDIVTNEIDYICNRFPDSIFEAVRNKSTVLPTINMLFSTGYAKVVINNRTLLYRCRTCAVRYKDTGISYSTRVDIIIPTNSNDHILRCSILISNSYRDSVRSINKLPGYTIILDTIKDRVCVYIGESGYVINPNDDLSDIIDRTLISGLMSLYHILPKCEGFCNSVLEDVDRAKGI